MASSWFIRQGGRVHGPFDSSRLKQLAAANRITPHSELAQAAEGPWMPAGRVKGLFQGSAAPPAQPASKQPPVRSPAPVTNVPLVLEPEPVRGAVAIPPMSPPPLAVHANSQPSGIVYSLGIGSIVLGAIGFMICWIPLLGLIGLPLSALGVVLGGIGIGLAFHKKSGGVGYPLAGTAISAVACLIAVSLFAFTARVIQGVDEAARQAAAEADETNQVVVSESDSEGAGQDDPVSEGASSSSPANQAGQQWAEASKAVQQGDVQVRILNVTEDFVKMNGIGDTKYTSKEKHLLIAIDVANKSETKKVTYRSWSQSESGRDESAELKDNFDNEYTRVTFGPMTRAEGQVTIESLYPGKSVSDLLVFEPPIEKAEHLLLALPASRFGGDGMLRFRIPLKSQDAATDADKRSREDSTATVPAKPASDGNASTDRPPKESDQKRLPVSDDSETSATESATRFPPLGDRYRNLPREVTDVVTGLRQLKAATEIGLNITAYKDKIQSVIPPAKLFLDSHEAKALPELAFVLKNACDCYVEVRDMWSKSIYADSPAEKYVASIRQIYARPRLWDVATRNVELAYALVGTDDGEREEAVKVIDATYDELTMEDALAKADKETKEARDKEQQGESRKAPSDAPARNSRSTSVDRTNIDLVALRSVAETLQNETPSNEAAEVLKDFLSLTRPREWVGKSGKKMFGAAVKITPTNVTIDTTKNTETVPREHLNPRTEKVVERIMDLSHKVQMLKSNQASEPDADK